MGKYWKDTQLNFNTFKDRADFIQQGKDANEYISQNVSDPSYYDTVSLFYELAKYENQKTYQYQDKLKEILESFDNLLSKIDMGGVFKKSRLKITDDKRGIFDFSIAAKGLYRKQEYFSIELAQDSPDEFASEEFNFKPSGVVPFEFVEETFVGEEKFFWYTSTKGKKYQLQLQQEGTRAVELKLPDAKLSFATKTKKSYVMFEKKGGKAKMVELFIPVNQGITLTTAMPLFLAAKFFQLYGVMTKISVIRMYNEGNREYVAWSYPIKDYGDEMDFNFMALNGVDTRWWYSIRSVVRAVNNKRLVEEKLKSTGQKVKFESLKAYGGGGSLPPDSKAYVELFSRYRNWFTKEIEKGNIQPLRTDKKLLISGVDEKTYGKSSLNLDQIKLIFFRIVDSVDFQFNKPEEACQRIYKRMVTEKLDTYYNDIKGYNSNVISNMMKDRQISLTAEFKQYVQSVLFDTYDYPEDGMYAEDPESARKLEEELDEKLEKLNQFLKTI